MAVVLLILGISVALVLAGSWRNLMLIAVTVVGGCFAVALAVGLMCNALGVNRYGWQDPIILLLPLPVLSIYALWAGCDCDPITLSSVRRAFADRRRLSSVRADVRRQIRQYSVEVA